MFTLMCARINGSVNNGEAGDLRRNRAHYDVIVMRSRHLISNTKVAKNQDMFPSAKMGYHENSFAKLAECNPSLVFMQARHAYDQNDRTQGRDTKQILRTLI